MQRPLDQSAGGLECFQGLHWLYLIPGCILFVVFVGFSARLIRVGGELKNVELTKNIFDWRGDSRKLSAYKHALSARSTTLACGTVTIKTVTVLATIYFGTVDPVTVATVACIPAPSSAIFGAKHDVDFSFIITTALDYRVCCCMRR